MCRNHNAPNTITDTDRLPRRSFLHGAAVAGVVSSVGLVGPDLLAQETAAASNDADFQQPSPEEALRRLKEGNRRYASGKKLTFQVNQGKLAELTKGQHPFATIIGCADSRVPVELIFDQDPGELFVIRLAGNVVDPDVIGSLEYAAVHLRTPTILVLGHEKCGAVTAAMSARSDRSKELFGVRQLLSKITPAIRDIDDSLPMDQQVALGVEANVRRSMKLIAKHPDHREAVESGKILIAGAVYELKSGRVRFLDD